MKKNYILPALFFCASNFVVIGQNCDPAIYYFDNVINNATAQIAITTNPGFWLATASPELSSNFSDMTLIRADALGNEIWRKSFGTLSKSDENKDLLATQDGNMLLAGQGNNKIRIVKVDENGATLWNKEYGEANKQYEVNQLYEDAQGNILVVGRVKQGSAISILVLKLDNQGLQLKKLETNPFINEWDYSWYPAAFGYSTGVAITAGPNGSYLLTGSSLASDQIFPSPGNVVVFKLDTNLDILWNKDFFGADGCYNTLSGQAIFLNADNSITIGVEVDGYCLDGGNPHHLMYKLDQFGNKLWEKYANTGALLDLHQTADGNFVGYSSYSNISKVDPAGNLIWKSWFQYEIALYGKNAVVEFPDGKLGFAGYKYVSGSKAAVAITDALGNNCKNRLSGLVYYDQNGNCKRDAGEFGLNNKILELNGGQEYTLSDQSGKYLFITDTTLQNIKAYPSAFPNQSSDFWQVSCPPSGIQTFGPSAPYQKPDSLHFALTPADNCPVLQLNSSLSSSRVCSQGVYQLDICNDGSLDADNVLVKLTLPAEVKLLDANFFYTFDGISYSFDLGAIAMGFCETLIISDSILCNAVLGTPICLDAIVAVSPSCSTYQYALSDQICRTLVNSYDPNDISGWIDNRIPCFNTNQVGETATVEYLIRFQNTGNDTAYRVMVIDTLPAGKFDMSTFRPGVSSHPYRLDFRSNNVLVWIFDQINLTDTVTNVQKSQGFVTFTVQTALPLSNTSVFQNSAAIYFDANPPVITNKNTIQKCLLSSQVETFNGKYPGLRLMPNPAHDYTEWNFDAPLAESVQIKCYTTAGILIRQNTLPQGASHWQMDTHDLANGMYFLQVETAGWKPVKYKLMVAH